MRLRTEIENLPSRQPISCRDGVFVLGSCFAENIGGWLKDCCMDICLNPFGVLYNPASIALALQSLLQKKRFAAGEMVQAHDSLYYSFAHHGKFSSESAESLASQLNVVQEKAANSLFEARHLLVTFGTAWVYERGGAIVANCHKFPAKEFSRRRLSVEEIVEMWKPLIESLGEDKHIVFTVSPIRHVKDGLHGNQLSKATLLLAIDCLCQLFPEKVEYQPIYELLIDDLRDYRFYAEDMVHPSPLAVEIVKDYFAENCLDKTCREFVNSMEQLQKSLQHKPFHPESETYRSFLCQTNEKIEQLKSKYLYV